MPRPRLTRRPAIDLELQARTLRATGTTSLEDALRALLAERVELGRILRNGDVRRPDRILAALLVLDGRQLV
jgi:hypothetical protein